MCLQLASECKIAKKDIVCYKVLRKVHIYRLRNLDLNENNKAVLSIGNSSVQGYMYKLSNEICFCVRENAEKDRFFPYGCNVLSEADINYINGAVLNHFISCQRILSYESDLSLKIEGVEVMDRKVGYVTYFREVEVEIGETYSSPLIFSDNIIHIGLHSFKRLKNAIALRFYILMTYLQHHRIVNEIEIVRCIIPKGSKYYAGCFTSYRQISDNYASDKLFYQRLI